MNDRSMAMTPSCGRLFLPDDASAPVNSWADCERRRGRSIRRKGPARRPVLLLAVARMYGYHPTGSASAISLLQPIRDSGERAMTTKATRSCPCPVILVP